MTGYLARLAARSLTVDDTVRPRAATIFEPGVLEGAAAAWLEQIEEVGADHTWEVPSASPRHSRSGEVAAPAPQRSAPIGDQPAESPALARATAALERREPAAPTLASGSANGHEAAVADAPRRVWAVGGEQADGPPAGDPQTQPTHSMPMLLSPPALPPLPDPAGRAKATNQVIAAQPEYPAIPATLEHPPPPDPDLPSRPAGVASQRHPPNLSAIAAPAGTPRSAGVAISGHSRDDLEPTVPAANPTRRARREASGSTGDPSLSTPTVQVTIGRVEVRAVTAPATEPLRRDRRPSLTLAEYLQAREAGR
jgi:hypothetical protein